ncbi:MAG: leucyl/phenylalanyl-tRNA--protein transferase [Bdellovibrionales bacterium]|nr:leucyl/phenylalanyl-tRNA--protein transferase [Bdellovibrionales bacterium]
MKLFAEKRQHFPHPQDTTFEGLLFVDDRISVDILLEAYSFGIFPWPQENVPLLWFSPLERGVLMFDDYHVSRSFEKFMRKTDFKVTFNQEFEQVIRNCQKSYRPDQQGTWITSNLVAAYIDFHKAGYAHSVECWQGDRLVGGLYGVAVAGTFCGESMFFIEPNASKFCLHKMVMFLKSQNIRWMDVQMVTPLLESFGARYLRRDVFLKLLTDAKASARALDFKTAEDGVGL